MSFVLLLPCFASIFLLACESSADSSGKYIQDFSLSYKTDIGLYDSEGKVLWESATSPRSKWGTNADQFGFIGGTYSLCPDNPANCDGVNNYIGHSKVWNAAGGNNLFNWLETHQYAIPASLVQQVKSVKLTVKTPGSSSYRVLHKDQTVQNNGGDWPSQDWSSKKPAPSIQYPLHGSSGDPIHLSVVDVQGNKVQGNRVLAVWISFRSDHSCEKGAHCCHLTNAGDDLWKNGFVDNANNCRIERPYYQCLQQDGSAWSDGKQAGFIDYVGSLNSMADGKPISIHFDDHVQSAIPFTNSYAQTEVVESEACTSICQLLYRSKPWNGTEWTDAISSCQVKQSKVLAKAGLGPIKITGYGRLSGFTLMNSGEEYFQQQVWKDFDGTNGGNHFTGGVFKDHYKTQEWNIMSGLVELTTSDSSKAFPIEIRDVAVAFAPKRGDGAILINAPYRPLDDKSDNNRPAALWDIKTPGAWVDAADGPNLLGDGSTMQHAYLHHADDLCKVSASGIHYSGITALQGSVGAVILLGNYGDGLRTGTVENSVVEGVSVHRVIHANGGYDGDGGILGTRTCPNSIKIQKVTVNNVSIPMLDDANTVDQLFAIGGLSGSAAFCGGNHGGSTFSDLHFQNWRIHVNPTMYSKFYNDGWPFNKVTVENVDFYDRSQSSKNGILESAVQIFYDADNYYCVCATKDGADKCWNINGGGHGTQNMIYKGVDAKNIWFPYGSTQESENFFVL